MTHVEKIEYRGFTIEISQDSWAENPWENWDGMNPMVTLSGGRHATLKEYGNAGLLAPFDRFTDGQLRRHMAAICAAFDKHDRYSNRPMADTMREECADCKGYMTDAKRDYLADAFEGLTDSDKLNVAADIFALLGYPVLNTSSHGYSQGDYAELLIVITPEFAKECGHKWRGGCDWQKDMESAAKLWGYWAWGDVYHYTIDSPIDDSCGGFYGPHDESGLLESAQSAIDHYIETQRKAQLPAM